MKYVLLLYKLPAQCMSISWDD